MTWIGACLVAAFFFGCLTTALALRPKRDPHDRATDRDYSQYPTENDVSNAAFLNAIAEEIQRIRKDAEAQNDDKRFWEVITSIGVWFYTMISLFIAGFAGWQVYTARDTEERQLRAYVGFTGDVLLRCRSCDVDL
jgi:hypothetical protein